MSVWLRRAATGLLLMALATCDSGRKGPGTLAAVVSGENLGAVVLEASGGGIRGFKSEDGQLVYSAVVSTSPEPLYRVIVVSAVGGALHFGIQVDDVGGTSPVVSVVSAVDAHNGEISNTGISVRISR